MWKLALLHLGLVSQDNARLVGRTISKRTKSGFGVMGAKSPRQVENEARLSAARSWQLAESMRQSLVPDTAFADPAWKLFLCLYIAGKEDRRCSIADACNATSLAQATALRWIRALMAEGSLTADQTLPLDARIDLTARKTAEMDGLMDAMLDAGLAPAPVS